MAFIDFVLIILYENLPVHHPSRIVYGQIFLIGVWMRLAMSGDNIEMCIKLIVND
jgi:hypothetical protein